MQGVYLELRFSFFNIFFGVQTAFFLLQKDFFKPVSLHFRFLAVVFEELVVISFYVCVLVKWGFFSVFFARS